MARRRPPGPRRGVPGVDTTVRLGDLTLPNPVVTASGTFGHGDEVARLCDPARLGAVTTKSQAPYPWDGNPAPRLQSPSCRAQTGSSTTTGICRSVFSL